MPEPCHFGTRIATSTECQLHTCHMLLCSSCRKLAGAGARSLHKQAARTAKLMAAPRFRHQVTEMGTRPRSCWWDQPSPCGRLFQRVRRSRGIERRMTRPSGFQSREISPPRPAIVVRTRRSPNPLLPVGDTTAGPPRSVQMTTKVSPWFAHWIRIRPAVAESAPYLVAFVANSLSSNARLEITDPEISTSHPVTENLEG